MKKQLLGALLVGSFASQSALADIRTFDFTASVASLATASNPNASSLDGILAGTTVALGDLIQGTLSFDDTGVAWGGPGFSGFRDTLAFRYTFTANGTTVDAGSGIWAYTPNFIGSTDMFNVVATTTDPRVASNLTLLSPHEAFTWQLGGATSSTLAVTWIGANNAAHSLNANLSRLAEVTPVPEPSSYAMLLLGAAVVAGVARRRAA